MLLAAIRDGRGSGEQQCGRSLLPLACRSIVPCADEFAHQMRDDPRHLFAWFAGIVAFERPVRNAIAKCASFGAEPRGFGGRTNQHCDEILELHALLWRTKATEHALDQTHKNQGSLRWLKEVAIEAAAKQRQDILNRRGRAAALVTPD